MDLTQMSALGAALGSVGLGLVALTSWLHLRAVIHSWERVTCTVLKAEEETMDNDGDTYWLLRLTFDTPRGTKAALTASYDDLDSFKIQKASYAPGTQHAVYIGPKEQDAYLTPPWSTHNPIVPAIFSIGFAAAAVGLWMGWIKTGG